MCSWQHYLIFKEVAQYIRLLVIQDLNLLKKDVKKHSPFQKVPYPVIPLFLQFISASYFHFQVTAPGGQLYKDFGK